MHKNKVEYSTISVLSVAHLINDTYSNFLPQFIPFLIAVTHFSYMKATFLLSVFTVTSSIVQPVLGFFIDRKCKPWLLYTGTLWMTVFLSLMGLTTNYIVLVLLSLVAGMGTAVFHPQASSIMGDISGHKKGFMMSAFMAMGNFGYALSPLVFIPLLNFTGLGGTVYLLIPGLLVSVFLMKFARVTPSVEISSVKGPSPAVSSVEFPSIEAKVSSPLRALCNARSELTKLVIVIVLRSVTYTGLIALLPSYFKLEKISILTSGRLMFLMLFAGVLGGISGGWLSDRIGRKTVTVISLILSTIVFFGFFYTTGSISYVMLAAAGALLMGSFSVTVVAAQEVIPENRGLASGISIGFSVGLGGLAVTIFGWLADVYGLATAVKLLFILPALGGIVGLTLKGPQSCNESQEPSYNG